MSERGNALNELRRLLAALEHERRRNFELRNAYAAASGSRFGRARVAFQQLRRALQLGPEPPHALGASPARPLPDVITGRAPALIGSANGALYPNGSAASNGTATHDPYADWRSRNTPTRADLARMRELSDHLALRPKISIAMPTYNTSQLHLREAIESVRAQAYPLWELCIADDASSSPGVRKVLDSYAGDDRIKVVYREQNGHISRALNSALELASGEFVGFLDHDDVLAPEALFEIALAVNQSPDVDLIYSDEDKIAEDGSLCEPHFKPDWSPESLLSRNYICHFSVYRKSVLDEAGGFRLGFEGSQDYDLVLRVSERTDKIKHVPKVLYHWRRHPASAASSLTAKPYAYTAAIRALREALERRGEPGTVAEVHNTPGIYSVRFAVRHDGLVSVIIPTRDNPDDLDLCLAGIFSKGGWENCEVLVVDNGSVQPKTLALFERWQERDRRVRVVRHDIPFNFSKLNNRAVDQSRGKYLLFLNDDTEPRSDDWISAMVEQAQRSAIGCVGGLLLYPDMTVQHAGVVVGLLGVAGHVFRKHSYDSPGYFGSLKSIVNYSALTAACLMMRREVFSETGGFDESLSVSFNDIDICLRVRDRGYRNVYLPHVILQHHESKSRGRDDDTPDKRARFSAEIRLMQNRWNLPDANDVYYNVNLSKLTESYSLSTVGEHTLEPTA